MDSSTNTDSGGIRASLAAMIPGVPPHILHDLVGDGPPTEAGAPSNGASGAGESAEQGSSEPERHVAS